VSKILFGIAAALAGVMAIPYALLVGQIGAARPRFVALGLLITFALLTIAFLRPQSGSAAPGSALAAGFLVVWGIAGAMSIGLPLLVAATLTLAALLVQGVTERGSRLLWIVPCLLVGLVIGVLGGSLTAPEGEHFFPKV
jgi:hypothetical protein